MRWDNLVENPTTTGDTALFGTSAVTTRTFDTPEFHGITCVYLRWVALLQDVDTLEQSPFSSHKIKTHLNRVVSATRLRCCAGARAGCLTPDSGSTPRRHTGVDAASACARWPCAAGRQHLEAVHCVRRHHHGSRAVRSAPVHHQRHHECPSAAVVLASRHACRSSAAVAQSTPPERHSAQSCVWQMNVLYASSTRCPMIAWTV